MDCRRGDGLRSYEVILEVISSSEKDESELNRNFRS